MEHILDFDSGSIEYHLESDCSNVFCGFDDSSLKKGEQICFIDHIEVDSSKRGKGVGSSQMQSLINTMKTKSITKFYLFAQVDPADHNDNEDEGFLMERLNSLMSFYARLGFCNGSNPGSCHDQIDFYLDLTEY